MMASFFLLWSVIAVVCPTLLVTVALALALRRAGRRKLARWPVAIATSGPAVHLVRPLCGREEGADEKNLSLLRQVYAPLSVAFVAESTHDPALADARRVCAAEHKGTCLTARDDRAVSGKARNMIAGWRSSTSEIVGFCDSDIVLSPDAVSRCVSAMQERGAAASFAPCLFDAQGGWGKLAMQVATIDKFALAEAAAGLGLVPCLEGGLMLVSRSALADAGGIELISQTIADDLRIGQALRLRGFRLGISTAPVVHRTPPESAAVWAQRYLRWSICRRTEAPGLQLLGLVLNPLAVPLVVAIGLSNAHLGALALAGALVRIGYAHAVSRLLLAPHGVRIDGWCWARPITELLDAGFVAAAFLTRSLTWRGCTYDIDFRGRVTRAEGDAETLAALRRGAPS